LLRSHACDLLEDNSRGYHTEFYLHNLSKNKGYTEDKFISLCDKKWKLKGATVEIEQTEKHKVLEKNVKPRLKKMNILKFFQE
jgi:hypothetical protein